MWMMISHRNFQQLILYTLKEKLLWIIDITSEKENIEGAVQYDKG